MIDEGMRALAEALRQQSAAYGFVARLLRTEVDDEALGRLRAMRFPAASGNDHLDAGYRGLCAYLNAGGAPARRFGRGLPAYVHRRDAGSRAGGFSVRVGIHLA